MWYVEKYQPDGKRPYLLAHSEDFAALLKMVTNRHRDRIEIVAPMDARAVDIKRLRTLGTVLIQVQPNQARITRREMRSAG